MIIYEFAYSIAVGHFILYTLGPVIIINRNRAVAIAAVHRETNWCAWKPQKKRRKDDDEHKMARKKNKETGRNAKLNSSKCELAASENTVTTIIITIIIMESSIFDVPSIDAWHLRFPCAFSRIKIIYELPFMRELIKANRRPLNTIGCNSVTAKCL